MSACRKSTTSPQARSGSHAELARAPAVRGHDASPGRGSPLRRPVLAPAVDHDDLDDRAVLLARGGRRNRAPHRLLDPTRLVRAPGSPPRSSPEDHSTGPRSPSAGTNAALRAQGASPISRRVAPPAESTDPSAPSYAQAGVDLDHDEGFVDEIREITRSTMRPEVLSSIGGFAGLFKAPERYDNPVFVAGADGVGTKLKLAAELGRFDTIGIDCVAMVVNDLVVQGAEPLVFLDYVAMAKLDASARRGAARRGRGLPPRGLRAARRRDRHHARRLRRGRDRAGGLRRRRRRARPGDRRLEHQPGRRHHRARLERLPQQRLQPGARASSTPGVGAGSVDLRAENTELNTSLAAALLAPTRIYVKPILNVMRDFTIEAMAHITGGGFTGNVPRVLPKGVRARIDPDAWPRPPHLRLAAAAGRDRRRGDAPRLQLRHRHGPDRARRAGERHPRPAPGPGRARLPHRRDRGKAPDDERAAAGAAPDSRADARPRRDPTRRAPRLRRWDAVVLGGALPGLVAAVRLAQRGLARPRHRGEVGRRMEPSACGSPSCCRTPGPDGVLGACLRALGVPLIDRRRLTPADVALQVSTPQRPDRVRARAPRPAELAAWGLVKPEAARALLTALDEGAEPSARRCSSAPIVRRRRRAGGARSPAAASRWREVGGGSRRRWPRC